MKISAVNTYNIFYKAIVDYHFLDDINAVSDNPYPEGSFEWSFYKKCWIDTVQWHIEDLIRDPEIAGNYALELKRRIDDMNQRRNDVVEVIDELFTKKFSSVIPQVHARHNTESLGWAFDRLSILAVREYHLDIELERSGALPGHFQKCSARKSILIRQKKDLMQAIDWLIGDIEEGRQINIVYKHLKMYNDHSLNPILYKRNLIQ